MVVPCDYSLSRAKLTYKVKKSVILLKTAHVLAVYAKGALKFLVPILVGVACFKVKLSCIKTVLVCRITGVVICINRLMNYNGCLLTVLVCKLTYILLIPLKLLRVKLTPRSEEHTSELQSR